MWQLYRKQTDLADLSNAQPYKDFQKHSPSAKQHIPKPHKRVLGQIVAISECKAEHVRVLSSEATINFAKLT